MQNRMPLKKQIFFLKFKWSNFVLDNITSFVDDYDADDDIDDEDNDDDDDYIDVYISRTAGNFK